MNFTQLLISVLNTAPLPKIFKRRLAMNHAHACQAAKCKVCKCRCKGKLHGHDHLAYKVVEDKLFTAKRALNQPVFESDIDDAIDQFVATMRNP